MKFQIKQILTNSNNPVFRITENGIDYILKRTNENEINCLKQLESPKFPKIIETFENKGNTYLIETFIEGPTVKELIEENRLNDDEIFTIIKNSIKLLKELDDKHIVNRDIKPSHIIVDSDLETSLIDFDTAKFESDIDTIDKEVIGTEGYAAPERYSGKSYCKSDVFSLGCILYFMIFKERPNEINNRTNKRLLMKDIKEVKDSKLSGLLKLLCEIKVKKRLSPDKLLDLIDKEFK